MLFRNRKLVRGIACFLLVEMLANILAPSVSLAAMGPSQPEFLAYEAPGASDMVNLATGDFAYSIPVLEVPGPERSFSLPLSYRAGIQLEQEASWVGLGWSMNPGAIARSVNGYADDAAGNEAVTTSTYHQDIRNGWTASILGLVNLGWDSDKGHYGSVDLLGLVGVGWSGGHVSQGDIIGIGLERGEGLAVNPARLALGVVSIASFGTSSAAMGVANAAKSAAIGAVISGAAGNVASAALGKTGYSGGGFGRANVFQDRDLFSTNYSVYQTDNRVESMYGSLFFGDMSQKDVSTQNPREEQYGPLIYDGAGSPNRKAPVFNYWRDHTYSTLEREVGADIHMYVDKGEGYYPSGTRPISIAHDNFLVMGEGVTGAIRPQRLEMGSVAIGKVMSSHHDKYSVTPFLNDYKVGFRYENSLSNTYGYHHYQPSSSQTQYTGADGTNWSNDGSITLVDPRLYKNTGAARTEGAREGIINEPTSDPDTRARGLVQGKDVRWFTNQEILQWYQGTFYDPSATPDPTFLEWCPPGTSPALGYRPKFTGWGTNSYVGPLFNDNFRVSSTDKFRTTLPEKGIGAFSVTAEDGTTYHYSLPVYEYTQFSLSHNTEHTNPGENGVATVAVGDADKHYAYATNWLLTSITSPDYIDRNHNLTVDSVDWGGWVKFDYGRFASQYKWRQPYVGESYPHDDDNNRFYTEGYKETYYLNSISTRTHTALFIKGNRLDGRGHFETDQSKWHLGMDNESTPSSSLRLEEVILLENRDLARLQRHAGIEPISSSAPELDTNTGGNASTFDQVELRNHDTYAKVYDTHDISNQEVRDFLSERAVKRLVFNYSYTLCPQTPNSFDLNNLPNLSDPYSSSGRLGKLTLESVSTFGPGNVKIIPDFVFAYGQGNNNPAYHHDHWDGFGMYNRYGTNTGTGHKVADNFTESSQDGAAWSLTEVITPLGGKIKLSYERDQYAYVSDFGSDQLKLRCLNPQGANPYFAAVGFQGDLRDYIHAGDEIHLTGKAKYSKRCRTDHYVNSYNCYRDYDDNYIALSVNDKSLQLQFLPAPQPSTCSGSGCLWDVLDSVNVTLRCSFARNRNGGDIRVASLTTTDEDGSEYQIRYRYKNEDTHQSITSQDYTRNSTGVISKEPEFNRFVYHKVYELFDYPSTPVMYSSVQVLRGPFRNAGTDADYDQREEYQFWTCSSDIVQDNAQFLPGVPHNFPGWLFEDGDDRNMYLDAYNHYLTVAVGKIGQAKSIRKFNSRGELEFVSSFEYSDEIANNFHLDNQGRFTEGVLNTDLLDVWRYRVNRTVKEYIPSVLTGITTSANGITVASSNERFDFYSGNVLEKSSANSFGEVYKNRTVPAYTLPIYATMGPKGKSGTNRNMLTQQAAVYEETADGTKTLSAAVQTWKNDWDTYRVYDNQTGVNRFHDVSSDVPIWRKHRAYVWNSPWLNNDGTYMNGTSSKAFVDFNWTQEPLTNQAPQWLMTNEAIRYDHFSDLVETFGVNHQHTSKKLGYRNTKTVAAASNARYTEIAYSGAEDLHQPNAGGLFFSEVQSWSPASTEKAHTGQHSVKVNPNQRGFFYSALANGIELTPGRKYRIAAWVRPEDYATDGRLFVRFNNQVVASAQIAPGSTPKAGEWYLLSLYFVVPATLSPQTTILAGCDNLSGSAPVYFDDFRFQPVDAPMSCYVYDPHTQQQEFVLNNDNLYTRFEYHPDGTTAKVYNEVLDRPNRSGPRERLVSETERHYRRLP